MVQVTDSRGTRASRPVGLVVTGTPLTIMTTALPGGTTGAPYSQTLTASGGTPPYTWAGSLPPGLAINPLTGTISGSTATFGSMNFGVTVQDRAGASASRGYAVSFALPLLPALSFGAISETAAPQSQPLVQLTLANSYPAALTGTLTLAFRADVGGDDQTVQFSSGGRTAPFTIAANGTAAVFAIPNLAMQTGTVAGLLTLTARLQAGGADVTPSPAPTRQIRINPSPPAIAGVQSSRTSTGFTVVTNGFSTTREVTQATFHFNGAAGADLQTTDLTMPVASMFNSWFQSTAVTAFGSQFLFTQSFTVQGDTQAIASVTVTLSNAQGNSQQFTAALQ
ncbi:MAG: hypothetical protein C5B51_20150 [Terriglobia bacterium]|nr:MAG: hypothetical protein C5B51_20150 [Terriglobia bacterium]